MNLRYVVGVALLLFAGAITAALQTIRGLDFRHGPRSSRYDNPAGEAAAKFEEKARSAWNGKQFSLTACGQSYCR